MDDMQAFDKQLASVVLRRVGPSEPVDDLAVFEAVTAANRHHRWGFTMFSALKFVAAAAIVALFGGLLLTGILTAPQDGEVLPAAVTASPTTEAEAEATASPTEFTESGEPVVRSDVLPGVELTVEEVEPGVYRVLSDGVRDLPPAESWMIAAGLDGSVWIQDYEHLFRLGGRVVELPTKKPLRGPAVMTTADGTLWLQRGDRLYTLDDGAWTVRRKSVAWFTIAPDDTVWVAHSRTKPNGLDFARLGADGWDPIGERLLEPGQPMAADGGGVWATDLHRSIWRNRIDDGAWHEVTTVPTPFSETSPAWEPVMGSDGSIWFSYEEGMVDGELGVSILRFDGSGWQRWGAAEGVPSADHPILAPAPDGTVWLGFSTSHADDLMDGIFRFDGSAWRHYLPDRYGVVNLRLAVAPDGSVWVLASEGTDWQDHHLYVITPEAVAAQE